MRSSPEKAGWVAAAALLIAGLALPAAASAGGNHGPDLVARVTIDGLGTPPHILVGASGIAPRFRIDVRTVNRGDRAAGPSKTSLTIDSGDLAKPYRWNVGGLGPGQGADHTVTVEGLRPELGFTEVTAKADQRNVVPEVDKSNNHQRERIAVEPREWDVSQWMGEDIVSGADNLTNAGAGLYFRFQKYQDGFVYQAFGPLTDTPKAYPGCAPVSGSKTITQTPWPMSILKIDRDLRSYDAFLPASSNSFLATCAVGGTASFPIQVGFLDLSTGPGTSRKTPEATELEGIDSTSVPGGGSQGWNWKFTAHLPKR